ncbi:unnamed protein product [Arctogadus glacialis]
MNIIQDKLGNEFLRSNGGMDSGFGSGMIMFSHLPPVTTFTRLAAQSVMQDLPPQEMIFKKERDSPGGVGEGLGGGGGGLVCGQAGDYVHTMGIKQEKLTEHDYRLPLYPGGQGQGRSTELLEVSMGNHHHHHHHQSLQVQDLSMANQLPIRLGKEVTGRKGRRSNGDGQEGKPKKRRSEAKQSMMLDADGCSLSPGTKPHICEHCSASFRSSYHLRRHVLIHTGERPFRCSQCNMSFIQKYLLQRHEKIHSGEKPFSCDQCNMRFIQKYHMERHKRTHSGEKPYRCETCQQYFSRTDRLLKHKRTCGEGGMRRDSDLLDLGCGHPDQAYGGVSQGGPAPAGRKKGRSKNNNGEGGERKRKKGAGLALGLVQEQAGYGVQHFPVDNHGPSASHQNLQGHPGGAPKMAAKKANRKAQEQAKQAHLEPSASMEGFPMMQSNGNGSAKACGNSSTYDDAMQFLKKRRYLNAGNNNGGNNNNNTAVASQPPPPPGGTGNEYDMGPGHLHAQPSVIQGLGSGTLDGEAPLALLDASHMGLDKLDRSGIPDEVLQSLLDHYAQKPDGSPQDLHFDLGDHHVVGPLHPIPSDGADGGGHDAPSPTGEKAVLMHEYSRFLLQALERTSHYAGFHPSPGPFSASIPGNPLYADKSIYTTSPLECGFGPSAGSPSMPASSSPSSTSSSSVPKSHFAMLAGSSPQHGFQLSGMEPSAHQQLTPSQELTEQTEKPHAGSSSSSSSTPPLPPPPPSSYQISPSDLSGGQKEARGPKGAYRLSASQDLEAKASSYHMENFAQAFGAQYKADGCGLAAAYGGESGGEVDHRIRSVSEFSGYSSLLSDVNEPVSTASKTQTSQSYR